MKKAFKRAISMFICAIMVFGTMMPSALAKEGLSSDTRIISWDNLTSNTTTVTVGDNSTTNVYPLSVIRASAPSSDCQITGWISPANAVINGTAATISVDNSTNSMPVDVTVSPNATWNIYSNSDCTAAIADNTMNLSVGPNTAYIKVTAQDGITTQVYTLTITRAESNACDITGWITPENPTIGEFTAETGVGNTTTSVVVNIEVSPNATWKLYSEIDCQNEIINKTMNLSVGSNTAYIKVTAEDGITTQVHTLRIERAASNACSITDWISPANPEFEVTQTIKVVNYETKSLIVNVSVSPNATWKLYSDAACTSEITNKKIALINVGSSANRVYIKVTAEDDTSSRIYPLTVWRRGSTDCDIVDWITPANPTVNGTKVNITVDNNVTSQVIAVTVSEGASWKLYRDSDCTYEIANKTMNLVVGTNTAYIKVNAMDDETWKVYTVTVNRSVPEGCSITGWSTPANPTVDGIRITKNVDNSTTLHTINLTTSPNATWKLYYNNECTYEIINKTMLLAVGNNIAYIKVTSEDGARSQTYHMIITRAAASPSGNGGSGSSTNNGTVYLNGQPINSSTGSSSATSTVILNTEYISSAMLQTPGTPIITIPTAGTSIIGQFSGELFQAMEQRDGVLDIRTANAGYLLPMSQINLGPVLGSIGPNVQISDLDIRVSVNQVDPPTALLPNNIVIIAPPVAFDITCSYGGENVDINHFNGYVERTIALPDDIDASSVSTGVVLLPDGTFRHVPTTVFGGEDGRQYASINSLTNSTYAVIWNHVEFTDAGNHWAKDSINNMGSRLIINGIGDNCFAPNRDITRAEFSAIAVRALGLPIGEGEKLTFADVHAGDWSYGYIQTAVYYGLISGYNSTTFGGNDKITREQAMTIIARAMKITKLTDTMKNVRADLQFNSFSDASSVSNYAAASVIACLKAGIVKGSNGMFNPKTNITRAETAVVIERLLTASDLI